VRREVSYPLSNGEGISCSLSLWESHVNWIGWVRALCEGCMLFRCLPPP
jgi:hypothetical protein